ncbi:unnamed protein product [Cylicocyclus nassatus]|uniref:Uncharacterized protein n=1 Tax=Cylicocyclus nassatus TaxID=53992 RepID=A0AA36HAP8_CYLNA|nr:unnamed protein product [Cylicocyclus nassatus]
MDFIALIVALIFVTEVHSYGKPPRIFGEVPGKDDHGADEEGDESASSRQTMAKSTIAITDKGQGFDYLEEEVTTTTKYKDKQRVSFSKFYTKGFYELF